MKSNSSKLELKKQGFTIIEVVLVLAIAGLIFLVVFLALPQLQESRRDNQRRRDADRLAAAVIAYQTDNGQSIPADQSELDSDVIGSYIKDFNDPVEGAYVTVDLITDSEPPEVVYVHDATCVGSTATANSPAVANSKQFAVQMFLEQASYCVDNN